MLVTLYTQPLCPFCDLMKSMLDEAGIKYKVTDIKSSKTALFTEIYLDLPKIGAGGL